MTWIAAIVTVLGIVGFATAVLDMMMNGSRYASWAPYGIGMAVIACAIVWLNG